MNGERKRIIIDAFQGVMYNKYTYCNGFELFLHDMTIKISRIQEYETVEKVNNMQAFEKFEVSMPN